MKAKIVTDSDGRFYGIRFDCPGCAEAGGKGAHILPVQWTPEGMERSPHNADKAWWNFNGNMEKPTFKPSILSSRDIFSGFDKPSIKFRCHSFIHDGRIEFLSDCTHKFAGQTIDLPDIE